MSAVLWSGSALWSTLNGAIRRCVEAGIMRPARLPCRVVSVGNIQVGGAGKTPLVAQVAREALARGLKVCILSRGYGGEWEESGGVLAPGARMAEARVTGDEPALLSLLIPEAWIAIGRDRVSMFEQARLSAGGFDLAILDDGFQHFAVHRDVDLVAVTSRARGEVLYRDWEGALGCADLIVWTKGEQLAVGKPADVKVRLRSRVIAGYARQGQSIRLVTAIGDGSTARQAIEREGFRVTDHIMLPDHALFPVDRMQEILAEAGHAGCKLGLTGKDWVKWRDHGIREKDIVVFEPEIVFEAGRERWERILWGG